MKEKSFKVDERWLTEKDFKNWMLSALDFSAQGRVQVFTTVIQFLLLFLCYPTNKYSHPCRCNVGQKGLKRIHAHQNFPISHLMPFTLMQAFFFNYLG